MSEPMIIIEPCAGLGNRLLGLGSAYAVAEKLNRRLVVMWKREVGCNIRFSELFDLPFEVVEISENGFKNEPVAQLLGNHAKKKWRKMADRFLECDDVEQVKETEGYEGLFHLIEQTPVIYLKAFGPICEVGAESYSFLKPGKNIEEKGDYLFRELTGNCVGVHVRRTDHTQGIERITAGCKADLPAVGCDRPRFERGNRGSICGDDRIVKVQKNFRKL